MKKKILSHLLCSALVILCSALMPILLFFQNVGSVKFYEIAIFIGIYSVIGLLIFWVLKLILKSEYKAAVSAGFISLLFQNAGRLSALISYKFVLVIFVVTVGILILVARKFLKEEVASTFVPVLSVVLTIFILFNTVMSIGKITSVANANTEIEDDLSARYEYLASYKNQAEAPEEHPNIYFIIVDEYAGFNSLKKCMNYDNSEFRTFLENHKFNISQASTNYMDGTYECIAGLFNLEFSEKNSYINTSEAYCKQKMQGGVLFKLAEDVGYDIKVAQCAEMINYESQTEIYGDKWSSTNEGTSTIDIMVSPSVLSPFVDKIRSILNGMPLDHFEGRSHVLNQAASFEAPLKYFAQKENINSKNTFNFCYAAIPHPPFFFDEKGNVIEGTAHLNNWNDPSYYLNQLKYTTTLLKDLVENITENDPDSIIILMSDHGVRNYSEGNQQYEWMNQMSSKDHTDILCAVYYKGEAFTEIEGLCGSNVLISIVNKTWGYNIPLIKQSDDFYYKH